MSIRLTVGRYYIEQRVINRWVSIWAVTASCGVFDGASEHETEHRKTTAEPPDGWLGCF